jgi:5-methylcytosine-specific restriction endonuclease McrA
VPDRKPTPIGGAVLGAPSTGTASLTALPPQLPVAEQRPASSGLPVPWGRRRVLLLNATFEPLTALPMRRAVVLVVCGKAEVVHGDSTGIVMHSATSTVAIPSVIRLSNYVRVPYRGRVPLTRAGLMHRDRYRCAYCFGRAETIDHVVPRSRGGPHTWQNCVASCAKCNHRKADKLLSELGWRLRVVPAAPRGPHWRLLAGVADADPLWLPYLGEAA